MEKGRTHSQSACSAGCCLSHVNTTPQPSGTEVVVEAFASRLRTLARSAGDRPRGPEESAAESESGARGAQLESKVSAVGGNCAEASGATTLGGAARVAEVGHTLRETNGRSAAAVHGAFLLRAAARGAGEATGGGAGGPAGVTIADDCGSEGAEGAVPRR